jgi:hypothetical protein
MRAIVFHLASRQRPGALIKLEFRPLHPPNFVASLRREQEQLGERPERPIDGFARHPEPADLVISQGAIARALFRRRLHPRDRRGREAVFFHGSIEQCAEPRERTIGLHLRTLGNVVNYLDYIAA